MIHTRRRHGIEQNDIRRLRVRATLAEALIAILFKVVAPQQELVKEVLDGLLSKVADDDPDREIFLEVARHYTDRKIEALRKPEGGASDGKA